MLGRHQLPVFVKPGLAIDVRACVERTPKTTDRNKHGVLQRIGGVVGEGDYIMHWLSTVRVHTARVRYTVVDNLHY